MNIGVVGGKSYNKLSSVSETLNCFAKYGDTLISGGSIGVDEVAKYFAINNGLYYQEISNKKTMVCNYEILDNSDIIFAFPSSKSKVTWLLINECIKRGKRLIIIKE